MKPRTIILLILALLIGAAAGVATYDLTRNVPVGASRASNADEDVGLTP